MHTTTMVKVFFFFSPFLSFFFLDSFLAIINVAYRFSFYFLVSLSLSFMKEEEKKREEKKKSGVGVEKYFCFLIIASFFVACILCARVSVYECDCSYVRRNIWLYGGTRVACEAKSGSRVQT